MIRYACACTLETVGRPLLRTPELTNQFISATILMLEDRGAEALTTRTIADATGSSLAALNDLFGSKAGLLDTVALHGFSELLHALDETTTYSDSRASILELCCTHRNFAAERPELTAQMYARPFSSFNPAEHDVDIATAIRRHFTNNIATLLQHNRSTSTVFDTTVGLIALLEGLTSQQRAGTLGSTAKTTRRRWNAAIEVYLDGASARFSKLG